MKLFALLALTALLTGCATTAPNNDPVVIRAEQTVKIAFDVLDGFLEWEYANRPALSSQVTDVANAIRRDAPRAFRAARSATKAYKANRTEENKATLDTALAVLNNLMQQAQSILASPVSTLNPQPSTLNQLAVSPAVIVAAIGALMQLLEMIRKLRDEAVRSKEWTAEEEQDVDNKLAEAFNSDHWKLS